jgi:hypothetical protein
LLFEGFVGYGSQRIADFPFFNSLKQPVGSSVFLRIFGGGLRGVVGLADLSAG